MELPEIDFFYDKLSWKLYPDQNIYKTERLEFLNNIIEKFKIQPLEKIEDALICLFSKVANFILKAVDKIKYNLKQKLFIIEMKGYADLIYNYTLEATLESGWRYYITGAKIYNHKIIEELQFLKINKSIPIFFEENIELKDITIRAIIDAPNFHCFELKIKNKSILLDCGLPFFDQYEVKLEKNSNSKIISQNLEQNQLDAIIEYLESNQPECVILTHNHFDHTCGLVWILKDEEKQKKLRFILGTKTTLSNYYSIIRKIKKISDKYKEKAISLRYFEKYYIAKNFYLMPLPAGHIPGSMSLLFSIQGSDEENNKIQNLNEWNFLYTSDFYIKSITPIDGFEKVFNFIPKNIDFAIIDGSKKEKVLIPFEKQLEDVYQAALETWNRSGSVLIATNPYDLAIFFYTMFFLRDYERKDKSKSKSMFLPYIYIDSTIYDIFFKLSEFNDDLSDEIKNMINSLHNPFQSWRIQNIHFIRSTFESLARPSLIITHPTNLNSEPIIRIFPIFSMNDRNLLIFGYFEENDEKISEGLFNKSIPIETESDLNGILIEKQKLKFKRKCEIFNLKEEFRKYLFELHPDQNMIKKLEEELNIKKKYYFHSNEKNILMLLMKNF